MTISRRAILGATALVPLAGCGIVTTTTTNGVTTVTVNVAKLIAYLSGAAALASAFLAVPGVGGLLAPTIAAAVNKAIAVVNADIPAVNTAVKGAVTISFNTGSPPAFLTSIAADLQGLQTEVSAIVTATGASLPPAATPYFQGILSVVNAFVALLSIPAAAPKHLMPVNAALALVHIAQPN